MMDTSNESKRTKKLPSPVSPVYRPIAPGTPKSRCGKNVKPMKMTVPQKETKHIRIRIGDETLPHVLLQLYFLPESYSGIFIVSKSER
jgi:hypothetical protein